MYIDTIGPSWKGVRQLLQQARHSAVPILPTKESMKDTIERAKDVNKNVAVVDDVTMDWQAKANDLYKLLLPKLNLELSTELRHITVDNGFELWRLLNRKLDPPRTNLGFHMAVSQKGGYTCADWF